MHETFEIFETFSFKLLILSELIPSSKLQHCLKSLKSLMQIIHKFFNFATTFFNIFERYVRKLIVSCSLYVTYRIFGCYRSFVTFITSQNQLKYLTSTKCTPDWQLIHTNVVCVWQKCRKINVLQKKSHKHLQICKIFIIFVSEMSEGTRKGLLSR